MIPEFAATYGLSPRQVWELTQSEWSAFSHHHDQLVRQVNRGG